MNTPKDLPKAVLIEKKWFREIDGNMHLMGGLCRSCGKYSFPVKPICPQCASDEQDEIPLSRTGRLHAFAVSVMGPADMEKPYIIGFVDLPEKIKLYSLINSKSDEHLKIGMEMEMVIDKIKKDNDGNDLVGYKFRPVSTGGRG